MKDITDANYTQRKIVCLDFKMRNLENCHDSYLQSETLLSADVFENFQNICLKIYEPDPDQIRY